MNRQDSETFLLFFNFDCFLQIQLQLCLLFVSALCITQGIHQFGDL